MLYQSLPFDPEAPLETFLERVPAAWCVYSLHEADGRPVQLLCVKNLRASLRRRLGGGEAAIEAAPSRRIDYRAVVRQVRWTRVDSAFEQNFIYLETARALFPATYAGVLGFHPAWWLALDPTADRPRPVRTTEPERAAAAGCFGPIPEKAAAQKLVHAVEELFDLCRDPAALAAAPAGPCQWRQMGKCVGPCDGSVSLAAYRALASHAADVLADVPRAVADHQLRMRHAAAALQFEAAGRIKLFIEQLDALRSGPYRHLRPLAQFRFLAVLPGRRKDTAKLFLVLPGQILPIACLLRPPSKKGEEELLRCVLAEAQRPVEAVLDVAGRERLSLVTHHLFPARKAPGVFIPLDELEERTLASAFREANRRSPKAITEDEEGEVRGLQTL